MVPAFVPRSRLLLIHERAQPVVTAPRAPKNEQSISRTFLYADGNVSVYSPAPPCLAATIPDAAGESCDVIAPAAPMSSSSVNPIAPFRPTKPLAGKGD